jgi:hypothetical protein
MYQYDDPSCTASLPVPAPAGTPGYFTNGSPVGGQPATILTADFMNMLQGELLNVVTAAGLTPSKTSYTQVLTAIRALATAAPVVGVSRNAHMYVSTASSSAAFTADELIVESALGGLNYKLSNLSLAINLAANGVGGLDTGSPPVNGYVPLYVIYNPTTGAAALMGKNTSLVASEVYNGAFMPAGYTASALVGILATNASSQIKPILINGRKVSFIGISVIVTSVQTGTSITGLSVSSALPPNAKRTTGTVNESSSSGIGTQLVSGAGDTAIGGVFGVDVVTPQFIYYTFTSTAGTPLLVLVLSSYEF